LVVSLGLGLLSASAALAVTPSFQGLGDLAGADVSSWANGVSADGSTVVGGSHSALVWQRYVESGLDRIRQA